MIYIMEVLRCCSSIYMELVSPTQCPWSSSFGRISDSLTWTIQRVWKSMPRSDTIHELSCMSCVWKKRYIKIVSAIPHVFGQLQISTVYRCLLVESHFGWFKLTKVTKIARFIPTNYRSIDPSEPGKSMEIPGAARAPGLAELLQSAAARSPGYSRPNPAGLRGGCLLLENAYIPTRKQIYIYYIYIYIIYIYIIYIYIIYD